MCVVTPPLVPLQGKVEVVAKEGQVSGPALNEATATTFGKKSGVCVSVNSGHLLSCTAPYT